jgi:hypothetical protein
MEPTTTVTTSATSPTIEYAMVIAPATEYPSPGSYPTDGLFDAFITGLDDLVLVPKSSLGAAILNRWLGRDTQNSIYFVGEMQEGLREFRLRFSSRPALTPGGGKEYSGAVHLTPEEVALLRATLDGHRNTKSIANGKARRRKAR